MYVGRDFTELSMISIKDWKESELAYFHKCLQQVTPYLNSEGVTIRNEIIEEIEDRGGLRHRDGADDQNGTQVHYD